MVYYCFTHIIEWHVVLEHAKHFWTSPSHFLLASSIRFYLPMSAVPGHVRPHPESAGSDSHGQVGQLGTSWCLQSDPRWGSVINWVAMGGWRGPVTIWWDNDDCIHSLFCSSWRISSWAPGVVRLEEWINMGSRARSIHRTRHHSSTFK